MLPVLQVVRDLEQILILVFPLDNIIQITNNNGSVIQCSEMQERTGRKIWECKSPDVVLKSRIIKAAPSQYAGWYTCSSPLVYMYMYTYIHIHMCILYVQ